MRSRTTPGSAGVRFGLRRFFAGGGDDEARRAFNQSRVEMMRRYAEYDHCRRAFILSYFGEAAAEDCDQVVLQFESVGYKTLSVELVTERGLLDTAS